MSDVEAMQPDDAATVDSLRALLTLTEGNRYNFCSEGSKTGRTVDYDAILDGALWLGNAQALLQARKIGCSAVLNCSSPGLKISNEVVRYRGDAGSFFYGQIEYDELNLKLPKVDDTVAVAAKLERAARCINSHIRQKVCPVLVVCETGSSRGAAAVLAFLILHRQLTLRQAATLVRERRPKAFPEFGFWLALLEVEASAGMFGAPSISQEELRHWLLGGIEPEVHKELGKLETLVSISGFSEAACAEALRKCDGDANAAGLQLLGISASRRRLTPVAFARHKSLKLRESMKKDGPGDGAEGGADAAGAVQEEPGTSPSAEDTPAGAPAEQETRVYRDGQKSGHDAAVTGDGITFVEGQ